MVAPAEYPAISDYGLIGDMHSCALVSSAGSVDWCCFPRFDSNAIFGRILDWHKGGYFKIAPRNAHTISRRYIPGTNVLQTTFTTENGSARLTDFMPVHHDEDAPIEPYKVGESHQIMRIIECTEGSIALNLECHPRFEYGGIIPHAHLERPNIGFAHGGSGAISLYCSVPLRMVEGGFRSEGTLRQGQKAFAIVTYESRFSYDSKVPQQCGDREESRRGDGVLAELE